MTRLWLHSADRMGRVFCLHPADLAADSLAVAGSFVVADSLDWDTYYSSLILSVMIWYEPGEMR